MQNIAPSVPSDLARMGHFPEFISGHVYRNRSIRSIKWSTTSRFWAHLDSAPERQPPARRLCESASQKRRVGDRRLTTRFPWRCQDAPAVSEPARQQSSIECLTARISYKADALCRYAPYVSKLLADVVAPERPPRGSTPDQRRFRRLGP